MEGLRTKFFVIFIICVWTVLPDNSNAHQGHSHSHPHPGHNNQMIVTKQSVVQIPESKDTNKCMALLRRTVVRKELLTYPCFHPVPGVVPVVAHQTPMGLVCRGYTNRPSTQYIRLPTCCPGYQPDHHGRCIKQDDVEVKEAVKVQPQQQHQHQEQKQQTYKRLEDLEKYPATYENKQKEVLQKVMSQPKHWMPHPMIMRRIDAIMKQRQHFLSQMKKDMQKPNQQRVPPAAAIRDLFPSIPHRLLGHQQQHQQQTAPQIPRPSEQAPRQEMLHQHHHMHHGGSVPHSRHHMRPELHAALHRDNIPHTHDAQGNPQLHAQDLKTNEEFLHQQHQHHLQMEAKQMQMSRQQQLLQLQQQRQQATAMRQQMLHQRRMQQAQLRRQQLLQQLRNAAQQNYRQMPHIPQQQQHPQQQQPHPTHPFVLQRTYTSDNKQFPSIPQMRASVMLAISPNSVKHFMQKTVQSFPDIPSRQMGRFRVQLPRIPVESPPVSISPGPNSPFSLFKKCRHHHVHNDQSIHGPPRPTCFAQYMVVLKKCFHEAGIDIPIDHNMFNVNFNYNGVCEKREMIMSCVFANLAPCNTPQEQHLIKSTIGHTVDEMNRFCQIGQINGIEERLGGRNDDMMAPMIQEVIAQPEEIMQQHMEPIQEMPIIPEDHHAMSLGQHTIGIDAMAEDIQEKIPEITEVHEQQAQPVDVPAPAPEKVHTKPSITISEHEDSENIAHSAHAHTQEDSHDHDHEPVSITELREESYYLPILIGTAIGVAGIFILLLSIVCICCRRRIKKKIYIQKETEKPKLFDVYTIGVPPPVYEVNGIPPISYEEAKGEKFTGSPVSVRRHNAENESQQQETRRASGVVSDI